MGVVSKVSAWGVAAVAVVALLGIAAPASADETLRVGKAQAEPIDFTPPDVGVAKGFFKKHGVDVEIIAFAGAAKQQQALVADAVDIGLGGGPEMSTVAKGTPVIAVAAYAGRPDGLTLVSRANGPIKTVADLKGRKVSASSVGSLTEWTTRELSRHEGWGPNGINIVFLGDIAGQIAALKTEQIDAMSNDVATAARLERDGVGHIVVNFGTIIPDFIYHVVYATKKVTEQRPEAVRGFLAGWFETIAWMKGNREEAIKVIAPIMHQSPEIAAKAYDTVMPVFSDTGRFEPKAVAVLSRSFVQMNLLPAEPDMSKLYTEKFLPGHS
jgi:NitT/TauT family transport system substrate-binding protein